MPRRLFPYNRFIGLDSVTSPTNMSERFLVELSGAYVDFRGQIVKGPGLNENSTGFMYNVRHYGADAVAEYQYDGTDVDIHVGSTIFSNAFQASNASITPISLVNFDQKLFAFMEGHSPKYWDGSAHQIATTSNANSLGRYPDGGHAVNVLNRLCVAGIPNKPTEIHISVQNTFDDWRTNTSGGTTPSATDGAIIDVKNEFSSNDTIQGLAVLEGDKLVVFGQNETLVYLADTNINQWQIARDFRVPIGIFGRNTAVNVGTDVFFCSRFGVHSLRRAASGLTLETIMLSREIQDLFRDAVDAVPTSGLLTEPHAVWDGELGQYHVFFPRFVGSAYTTTKFDKLTFTYEPGVGRGGFRSFSFTPDTDQTCGSFFAKPDAVNSQQTSLQIGSTSGRGNGQDLARNPQVTTNGGMTVRTPLLSQSTPDKYKMYKRLIVRAVGDSTATFHCRIYDENSNLLQDTEVTPEPDGFGGRSGINNAQTRPIDIPIPHRAMAVSVEFFCDNIGELRILDFGLVVDIK